MIAPRFQMCLNKISQATTRLSERINDSEKFLRRILDATAVALQPWEEINRFPMFS